VPDVVEDVVDLLGEGVLSVVGRRRGALLDELDNEVEYVLPEGAHLVGARLEGDR
jgi:hypothetical protein